MTQPAKKKQPRRRFDAFPIVNTLIMLIVIVVMLYPFLNTIAISFNDAQDTLRGGIGPGSFPCTAIRWCSKTI